MGDSTRPCSAPSLAGGLPGTWPVLAACDDPAVTASLHDVLGVLRGCRWVDLTHAFAPGIPHFAGFPDEQRSVVWGFHEGDGPAGTGFLTHRYEIVGQWGTHVDPPAHFVEDGRTLDEVPVTDMILELVVLDVRAEVAAEPGFAATAATVAAHEAEHGTIPAGSFVALLTGAGDRWRWQIELLANLGQVPRRGALIVATWPKPLDGSGFPARCFAIVPG